MPLMDTEYHCLHSPLFLYQLGIWTNFPIAFSAIDSNNWEFNLYLNNIPNCKQFH
jgi:hypothetical protein